MKQNKFIKRSGPFKVHSISQNGRGVRLEVYPAFPKYEEFPDGISWAIHRQNGDGGGPSIFTAIALAEELEKFLNQPYSEAMVQSWKSTLETALEKVNAKDRKHFEKAMVKLEKEERQDEGR